MTAMSVEIHDFKELYIVLYICGGRAGGGGGVNRKWGFCTLHTSIASLDSPHLGSYSMSRHGMVSKPKCHNWAMHN